METFFRILRRLGFQLGDQNGSKSEKWLQKFGAVPPKSGSEYEPAFQDLSRAFWPRFLGAQGSIFNDVWMIFRTSWLTLGMFSAALAGGATPFQTPPLLTWFSLFLVRSSANFAKKIQELAEDKAENPRTCREQSRKQNPYRRLQENSNLKALFFSTPSLSQTCLLQKRWAAVLPPGWLQSAAQPGTAC